MSLGKRRSRSAQESTSHAKSGEAGGACFWRDRTQGIFGRSQKSEGRSGLRPALAFSATLALALAHAASGCVCEKGDVVREAVPGDDPKDPRIDPRAPPLSKETVVWDFKKSGEPPLLSLWPKDPTAPVRKRSAAKVSKQGEVLVAETEGADSWLLWQFDTPLHFATLSVELVSPVADRIQLYWTSIDCAIFSEKCSSAHEIVVGRQFVDLVPGTVRAIREVRLDLPAKAGVKLEFHQVRLFSKPVLHGSGNGHEPSTKVQPTPEGLAVESASSDPWVRFPTPWLSARGAETVELELEGAPPVAPQLFFVGSECPQFNEACSVQLTPAGPSAKIFRARLSDVPQWRGQITALRLDPSTTPGRYLIQRMSLIRPPPAK